MSDTLMWPATYFGGTPSPMVICNLARWVIAYIGPYIGAGFWADYTYAGTVAGNNYSAAIDLVNGTDIRLVPWGAVLAYVFTSETAYTMQIVSSGYYAWQPQGGNVAAQALPQLITKSQIIVYPGQAWHVNWNSYNNIGYGGGADVRTMYDNTTILGTTGSNSIPCNGSCVGTDYGVVETGTVGSLHLVIPTTVCPDPYCCPDPSDNSGCSPDILTPCQSDANAYSIGMNIPPALYWSDGSGGGNYTPQAQLHI